MIALTRRLLGLVIGCSLIAVTLPAWAVNPVVSTTTPLGVKRGADTEWTLRGSQLADLSQVMFHSPGLEIKSIGDKKDNAVTVTLSVAADCPLGLHAFHVVTETGVAAVRMLSVGPFDEVDEVEPNNEFTAPQAISINSTVRGVVTTEDIDYYVVEAKAGERISAELEGLRLGTTTFDPSLAILDEKRFELARSDDAVLLLQDSICSVVVPADGKYLIQVQEASFGGSGSSRYRLSVGHFPRPLAVYPAGAKPGETIKARWIGDAAGDFETDLVIPADAPTNFAAYAQDNQGIAVSPNMMRVNDLENSLEAEPNNTFAEASPGIAPGAMNGIIEQPGDIDYFKFSAKKGQQFDIRVYARKPLRSPLDSVLNVRYANGKNIASNDDTGGPDSYYKLSVPADGEYLVSVRDHLKAGGPAYIYRIEITPVQPKLSLTTAEKSRYVATMAPAPQNNRVAVMVNASRVNFGGDIQFSATDLPAGMTMNAPPMPGNRSTIPVLFEAAADAPLGGSLANILGETKTDKLAVSGGLNQRFMLVRGGNNNDVWGFNAKRLAVAVTKPAPYSIEIVQPKVPIVRNGSMKLKVVAKRAEGFTGPIAVRMLYNPPGIGSASSISIPEGKNEAEVPLTANSGASIATWPITITAKASSLETASSFAQLEVAEPFIAVTFVKSAAELGQETTVMVKIEKKADFAGVCKLRLLGLPAKTSTSTEMVEITSETTEATFDVKIDADARPAKYTSLVCQCEFTKDGEPIVCTFGGGELRVDKPLPPKVDTPKPAPKPVVKTPAPAKPAPKPKPLSRLEQLRQERLKSLQEASK